MRISWLSIGPRNSPRPPTRGTVIAVMRCVCASGIAMDPRSHVYTHMRQFPDIVQVNGREVSYSAKAPAETSQRRPSCSR